MDMEGWLALGVTVLVFIALVRNWAQPDVLFLMAVAVLAVAGVISPAEALAGFSNSGVLTVGALFVVAAGLRETGVLDGLGRRLLGRVTKERRAMTRIAALVVPLSAFLNNTPIVAMMMPVVIGWCRRQRVSPSKLLIPLSYFALLGGTCTLIGTSTNLAVNGLMTKDHAQLTLDRAAADEAGEPAETASEQRFRNGLRRMGLFELAPIGLPYAIIGFLYLQTLGRKLLPERKELLEQLGESRREYLLEMLVQPECRLIGQTVSKAGLRHLPGLFLIEIDRDGTIIAPVGPQEVIQQNDRLVFTGVISTIVELEQIPGLVPAASSQYEVSADEMTTRSFSEAVISNTSPLVGKTVRESDFRALYNAAVVAVHRNGARLPNKIGDIVLQPGDTLLLQAGPHFMRAHRNHTDFFVISNVENALPTRRHRAGVALGLFALLLVLMSTAYLDLALAAILVAALMVLVGCISAGDARNSIEWQVLITIAASFGVGEALKNSGAATVVAGGLVQLTSAWGSELAALACIYILGSIVTEMITNNAAAVLLFPFCVQTARLLDCSPRPFLMALVLAASASFMTPIGYQTNMMVYGPGGYRFTDFSRVGFPLHAALWVVAVLLIPLIWPFDGGIPR